MPDDRTDLALAFGFSFADLWDDDRLSDLDRVFVERLKVEDPALAERLAGARDRPRSLAPAEESALLIELAVQVERFVADLFGVGAALADLSRRHEALAPLYSVKRLFVQRRAARAVSAEEASAIDGAAVTAAIEARLGGAVTELSFAEAVTRWMADEAAHGDALADALAYAAWALHAPAGRLKHAAGVLFQVPERIDPLHLVELETRPDGAFRRPDSAARQRDGFSLTDPGTGLAGALDEANYCIWCHNQGKDSCSHGLKDRKTSDFQRTVFGVELAGCPLEEKISEFHTLKAEGRPIAALAMIARDNPLCAATGHRICNDCMKSCIFQRQEPVDIPQAETRTLKDVLSLPWGFEIYALLTRWNPLDLGRPAPRPATGRSVLVVGLGPAGFGLAHHLANDGHTVVAVDGLKIEPVDPRLSGVDAAGKRVPFEPLRDWSAEVRDLATRPGGGFGGVAEYGITVRWDKNFLLAVRLILERRARFSMIGGVRFGGGGTVSPDDAFAAGFDHVALCSGAGKPTVVPMKNGIARGVRMASDFLMALQLTGAARMDSLANLQIRLPIVVIGGGLTAIDTATESLAYYPVQVEKFLTRYEILAAERGEAAVRAAWSEEEVLIADEFIAHARAIRALKAEATSKGRAADVRSLLLSWGGATIVYRRRLVDAPSYTLNHEEVRLALEEGPVFAERLAPIEVEVDRFGHAEALVVEVQAIGADGRAAGTGERRRLQARAILVAAGTKPNTVLAREDGRFRLDGLYFQAIDGDGNPVRPDATAKPSRPDVLLSRAEDGRAISFWGDLHPSFHGNVVKALGGAAQGYPVVSRLLAELGPAKPGRPDPSGWAAVNLRARVHAVRRLTPTIVEVVVEAPAAARAFRPGQFFRLQNFEALAEQVEGTVLAMEGLAMTGASVDRDRGLVSTIVLEMGGSSNLGDRLEPGEPVVLMGPTGSPTVIRDGETVLLAGGGLGNAVLFSIGQEMCRRGCRVVYVAGYKRMADRYKVEEIEAAADVVVWACDEAPGFLPRRPQDLAFVGNIVEAIRWYGETVAPIPLAAVDRVIAIGSDGMMAAVAAARHAALAPLLKPGHVAVGSINSPMQCMMKEICAQCLQVHRDPETGVESIVFSCFDQDQPLDRVDFGHLRQRLMQNAVQEKLTAQWIERVTAMAPARSGAQDPSPSRRPPVGES